MWGSVEAEEPPDTLALGEGEQPSLLNQGTPLLERRHQLPAPRHESFETIFWSFPKSWVSLAPSSPQP